MCFSLPRINSLCLSVKHKIVFDPFYFLHRISFVLFIPRACIFLPQCNVLFRFHLFICISLTTPWQHQPGLIQFFYLNLYPKLSCLSATSNRPHMDQFPHYRLWCFFCASVSDASHSSMNSANFQPSIPRGYHLHTVSKSFYLRKLVNK